MPTTPRTPISDEPFRHDAETRFPDDLLYLRHGQVAELLDEWLATVPEDAWVEWSKGSLRAYFSRFVREVAIVPETPDDTEENETNADEA